MRSRHAGMTLVELLVAMIIGLVSTLAITSLLIASENHKRTTTSVNDAEQTGTYAFYTLDRAIRGGGSGFMASAYVKDRGVLGCKLNVSNILPRAAAMPDPFGTAALQATTSNLRIAPVVIAKNQSSSGSDVLIVMNGSGAAGGVPRQITSTGGANTLVLDNAVGFVNNDLALVSQSGISDCLLEQVTGFASGTLTIGGTYYTAGATTPLSTFANSTLAWVTPVGNATANNLQLYLYGVGSNRTLFSYDALRNLQLVQGNGGDASQPMADGVDQMHAIYGIDTNADGKQDGWADPGAAAYTPANVMTSPALMQSIVSVRVSLVLRSNYYDKNVVSPASLILFKGLTSVAGISLQQTAALAVNDQHYRYRVFEFTVPIRNVILLAGGP